MDKYCSSDVDAPIVQRNTSKYKADGFHGSNRVFFLEPEHIRHRHDLWRDRPQKGGGAGMARLVAGNGGDVIIRRVGRRAGDDTAGRVDRQTGGAGYWRPTCTGQLRRPQTAIH